jgi:Protein of unknown function, DUF547
MLGAMMLRCFAFLFALSTLPVSAAGFDHQPWDRVLKSSVNAIGEVDYASLKNNTALGEYVAALRAASPDTQPALFGSKSAELAYWINAYNALVTFGVVKAYPTKSVRDLGVLFAFFRRKEYVLGGRTMSLQQLENEIIRQRYREPRIHFAIVCASLSCPKLSRDAYTAENLEAQLDFQTRQYFAETRNLAVAADGKSVLLAAILDWFKEDFGGSKQTALAFARRHAPATRQKQLDTLSRPRLIFREYDWAINDPGSRARARTPEERELAQPR